MMHVMPTISCACVTRPAYTVPCREEAWAVQDSVMHQWIRCQAKRGPQAVAAAAPVPTYVWLAPAPPLH